MKPSEPTPDYHSATGVEATRAERCHIVDDPAGGGGKALEVFYPEDEILGINERVYLENAVGYEPRVAHARFELFFPEDWQTWDDGINGGTKLPGWADHRGTEEDPGGAAGGNHNQGASYSMRMGSPCQGGIHDASGGAEVPFLSQVYDATVDPDEHKHGWHHCWTEGGSKGEWTTIDYRITLNTPGVPDGRLEGWVNGVKAWDYDEYLFLEEEFADRGIPYWRRHYHFGGDWGSPVDNDLYERNLSIWVDDNVPEM
ncbi:hypothetical protein [Haloterrigena salifodinae]|uniref:hypothetical protein n=1 Tax=Haloterrigena salifodinae TaxID=2675099 RepID=UPI000F85D694|nr:hypothetical protein [Haloterrigena salifodinae]